MSDPTEFSVALFFPDDSYVYEQRQLTAKGAAELAYRCSRRPAALAGMIRRIIITDGGDNTCFEWTFGRGVTFK